MMTVTSTALEDVLLIEPTAYADERGYFMELWHQERYASDGLAAEFVQDNVSWSKSGVLRGLHYQYPRGQGKLVMVLAGEVFDVAVDIRRGSETFGGWTGHYLSSDNRRQLYIPPGFAHGFMVTGAEALVLYKCTALYAPDCEHTIRWDDPSLGIEWPGADYTLSEKDATAPLLRDLPESALPAVL